MQLTSLLVFIGRLLPDLILLPKRRIIYRPGFVQINAYYTAVNVTYTK